VFFGGSFCIGLPSVSFFVSSAVCINCVFHILFIMFSAVIETFLQSSPDVGIIAV